MNTYKVITISENGLFSSEIINAEKFKISPNGDLIFFSGTGDVDIENTAFAKGNWLKVCLYS